ncbi:MAG TPA: kelch repeat-containing protein [Candidatus Binataceae bacterium]|nr:kelch repeat-containing protein [Candidatus Binataceae bacterium]
MSGLEMIDGRRIWLFLLLVPILCAASTASAIGEPTPPGRESYIRMQLNDGRVLFAGGADDNGHPIKRAEIFDPSANKFRPSGAMVVPRCGPTATLLPNGSVLIAGGATCSDAPAPIATLEVFDPASGTFHAAVDLIYPRFDLNAMLLKNGKVLIAQGYDGAHNLVGPAEIFDPVLAIMQRGGSMVIPRCFGSETQLPGDQVLIAGGVRCDEPEREAITAAEIYDPAGQFGRVGAMNTARVCHSATVMKNGKVLIAGGASALANGIALSSAEIYDPDKATFAPTGSMTKARACPTATARDDGTVVVKGGHSQSAPDSPPVDLTDSEIFDPTTGKFTAASLAE